MQIICNNCGNDLTFPNQQHLVTCPHCLTHLEIKELDNTISATIVENIDFDDTIFQQNHLLANAESFAPLYNLLHLENQYSESIEENSFRTITLGKRFRPVIFRAISRIIFGITALTLIIEIGFFGTSPIFLLLYGLILILIGINEFIHWWNLRQFEKYYFQELSNLLSETKTLNLTPQLARLFTELQENQARYEGIRSEYFNIHYFFKIKIPIGTSVFSQSFRLIPLSIILLLTLLFTNSTLIFILILLIVLAFFPLFFIILAKSSDYHDVYTDILKDRKAIVDKLTELVRQ